MMDEAVIRGEAPATQGIGLALSGGGMRAAVFHLGVLRCLAARGVLEKVTRLSTVSGGSLVAAAVISASGLKWPASSVYLATTYPALQALLTTRDLFSLRALGIGGLLRHNTKLLNRRADILSALLHHQWKIDAKLADLPESPVWWINTTCIETGKNWSFSKREMGDWKFGKHYVPPYGLAEAVAASAAVPYAIGALQFKIPQDGWYATDPATQVPLNPIAPPLNTVHLWDGGAYENLGLEPLYKASQGLIGCDFMICSDASGPLPSAEFHPLPRFFKGQLASPRLFDIASDQIRGLRSRMFIDSVKRGDIRGTLFRMGNSARNLDIKTGVNRPAAQYDNFLSDAEVAMAATYPTDLNMLTPADFDRIARHGYEVADTTLTAYAPQLF